MTHEHSIRASRRAVLALACLASLFALGAATPPGEDRYEGYGAASAGGDGKPIVAVTALTDAAVRAAFQKAASTGSVQIVFQVKGDIAISDVLPVLTRPFVTVDGQSGVAVWADKVGAYGRAIEVTTNDVVLRNFRIRNGGDNLSFKAPAAKVTVSHVSSTGAYDDGCSMAYGSRDATIQWCFFGGNTRSTFIRYNTPQNISYHHNLLEKQWIRGPLVSGAKNVDIRNTIVRNWSEWGTRFESGSSGNAVNNLRVLEANAGGKPYAALYTYTSPGPAYFSGNVGRGCTIGIGTSATPIAVAPVTTDTVADMEPWVMARAGCSPRDSLDALYIKITTYARAGDGRPIRLANPTNKQPTAKAAVSVSTGRTITYDGSGSTDSDGTVVRWYWNLGDGRKWIAAKGGTYTYAAAGTYWVTLLSEDNYGAQGRQLAKVTVGSTTAPGAPTVPTTPPPPPPPPPGMFANALFIGFYEGTMKAYDNAGGTTPVWRTTPAWDLPDNGTDTAPTVADLDGDGKPDLLLGERNGIGFGYRNDGTAWVRTSAWDTPDVGYGAVPALGDLDGDGDLDVLVGATDGITYGFKNTGSPTAPAWARNAAWNTADAGGYAKPCLADLDGDGDLDLLIGEGNGASYAYKNAGSRSAPVWTSNPAWGVPDLGGQAAPALKDLDGDGDVDLIVGTNAGHGAAFQNTGSAAAPIWTAMAAWNVPDIGTTSRPTFLAGSGGSVAPPPPPPPPPPPSGTIYVVSPSGNDANPGTAQQPWKTISKAASVLKPGETVRIRTGTYPEQVVPAMSGTESAPIAYEAFPGEKPVVDGKGLNLPEWQGLVAIDGKSHILIRGLTVQNAGPRLTVCGIRVSGSDHVTIQGNRTYNTASSGIGVWNSRNVRVDGNEIELACNDGRMECLTVAVTEDFEVRDNHVHHSGPGSMGGEGIDAKDGSRRGKVHHNHVHHINRLGIYADSWNKPTSDIEIFENRVHHCQSNGMVVAAEAGGLLERVRIYHNVVYQNSHNGMIFASWGEPTSHPMRDIVVEENIFWGNGTVGWGGGIRLDNKEAAGLAVRRNVVSANNSFQIVVSKTPVSAVIEGNLIHGFKGYPGETRGTSFVEGDPLFKDPENGDFGLLPASPASGFWYPGK